MVVDLGKSGLEHWCLLSLLVLLTLFGNIHCRGRLSEPPQRSSLWRYPEWHGKPMVATNRDDSGLNCGGFWKLHEINADHCGVCGDPYDGTRKHEAGGRFAHGYITRTYHQADLYINVTVDVSTNIGGFFEFRLCPNNNFTTKITQECLDQYPLIIEGFGRHYYPNYEGVHKLRVKIPEGVTCSQCVLQWKWKGSYYWGTCDDGFGGVGCGNQEEYYNCADIAIVTSQMTSHTTERPVYEQVTSRKSWPVPLSISNSLQNMYSVDTVDNMNKPSGNVIFKGNRIDKTVKVTDRLNRVEALSRDKVKLKEKSQATHRRVDTADRWTISEFSVYTRDKTMPWEQSLTGSRRDSSDQKTTNKFDTGNKRLATSTRKSKHRYKTTTTRSVTPGWQVSSNYPTQAPPTAEQVQQLKPTIKWTTTTIQPVQTTFKFTPWQQRRQEYTPQVTATTTSKPMTSSPLHTGMGENLVSTTERIIAEFLTTPDWLPALLLEASDMRKPANEIVPRKEIVLNTTVITPVVTPSEASRQTLRHQITSTPNVKMNTLARESTPSYTIRDGRHMGTADISASPLPREPSISRDTQITPLASPGTDGQSASNKHDTVKITTSRFFSPPRTTPRLTSRGSEAANNAASDRVTGAPIFLGPSFLGDLTRRKLTPTSRARTASHNKDAFITSDLLGINIPLSSTQKPPAILTTTAFGMSIDRINDSTSSAAIDGFPRTHSENAPSPLRNKTQVAVNSVTSLPVTKVTTTDRKTRNVTHSRHNVSNASDKRYNESVLTKHNAYSKDKHVRNTDVSFSGTNERENHFRTVSFHISKIWNPSLFGRQSNDTNPSLIGRHLQANETNASAANTTLQQPVADSQALRDHDLKTVNAQEKTTIEDDTKASSSAFNTNESSVNRKVQSQNGNNRVTYDTNALTLNSTTTETNENSTTKTSQYIKQYNFGYSSTSDIPLKKLPVLRENKDIIDRTEVNQLSSGYKEPRDISSSSSKKPIYISPGEQWKPPSVNTEDFIPGERSRNTGSGNRSFYTNVTRQNLVNTSAMEHKRHHNTSTANVSRLQSETMSSLNRVIDTNDPLVSNTPDKARPVFNGEITTEAPSIVVTTDAKIISSTPESGWEVLNTFLNLLISENVTNLSPVTTTTRAGYDRTIQPWSSRSPWENLSTTPSDVIVPVPNDVMPPARVLMSTPIPRGSTDIMGDLLPPVNKVWNKNVTSSSWIDTKDMTLRVNSEVVFPRTAPRIAETMTAPRIAEKKTGVASLSNLKNAFVHSGLDVVKVALEDDNTTRNSSTKSMDIDVENMTYDIQGKNSQNTHIKIDLNVGRNNFPKVSDSTSHRRLGNINSFSPAVIRHRIRNSTNLFKRSKGL